MKNIELAKECGATVQRNEIYANNDPDSQVIGDYPTVNFSEEALDEYTSRVCTENDTESMKYQDDFERSVRDHETCKGHADYLRSQLYEANALIAMQAQALDEMHLHAFRPSVQRMCNDALAATSETVDEWRAKETEPLRMEVAMLRSSLDSIKWHRLPGGSPNKYQYDIERMADLAIFYTKATAEAYWRDVRAKALEEAANIADHEHFGGARDDDIGWTSCAATIAFSIRAMKGNPE